jgi:hypothetical protein
MDSPSADMVEAIEDYESHRAGPMTLEKIQSERTLRDLLIGSPIGVVHNGFRYSFCRHDAWISRTDWKFGYTPKRATPHRKVGSTGADG